MRIDSFDGKEERSILIGCIVSHKVLARIVGKCGEEPFSSKWANLVWKWCVKHFQKYNAAPGKDIEGIFSRWAKRTDDKSTIELIETFLESLSQEYDENEINPDYIVDRAAEYFNQVKLKNTIEEAQHYLDNGHSEKAKDAVQGFRHLEMGVEESINPYQEIEIHKRVQEDSQHPLIEYPGPLGRFMGNRFRRGEFIVFQAPEKGKKSFWVMDTVHRALMQRNRVLYLLVGDMSETDIVLRMQSRLCNRPHYDPREPFYYWPKSLKRFNEDVKVVRERRKIKGDITLSSINKAQQFFNEAYLRSDRVFLKQYVLSTLSISEIESRLIRYRDTENWIPDVIALDYIDLLDPPAGIKEKRDQINENWRTFRSFAHKYHCLTVTATQADAQAWKRELQDRSNFSDDKRKYAHACAVIGINQPERHEEKQLFHLNYIVVRGRKPRPIWTAGCLAVGNPAVLSC